MIRLIFFFLQRCLTECYKYPQPHMQADDFALTSQPVSVLKVSMLKVVFREIQFSKLMCLFS